MLPGAQPLPGKQRFILLPSTCQPLGRPARQKLWEGLALCSVPWPGRIPSHGELLKDEDPLRGLHHPVSARILPSQFSENPSTPSPLMSDGIPHCPRQAAVTCQIGSERIHHP